MELTRNELNLLLYLETRATGHGGLFDGTQMEAEDISTAGRWNVTGFLQFGQINAAGITASNAARYWCILSDEAWGLAHAERRARCERAMKALKVERIGVRANDSQEVSRVADG